MKDKRVWRTDTFTLALFIHEEYVFRTKPYQTLTTTVELLDKTGHCTVTVIGSGGGGGWFNISWGSQEAGENTIIKKIRNLTRN